MLIVTTPEGEPINLAVIPAGGLSGNAKRCVEQRILKSRRGTRNGSRSSVMTARGVGTA
jgi:hypothetical protein